MKKILLKTMAACLLIAFSFSAVAQSNSDLMFTSTRSSRGIADYSAIDNYVKSLNITTDMSYQSAAEKICQTAQNDMQKARAIYYWIAKNITYDYNFTKPDAYMADTTWANHTGVCQGYSELYIKLARCVGLNAEYCNGMSKSADYVYSPSAASALSQKSHGWVVVHINGKHILMDPTWASTANSFDEWFDVDPAIMVTSHMPFNELMAFLPQEVSEEKFKMMPRLSPLLQSSINGNEVYDFFLTHSKAWAPSFWSGFEASAKSGLKIKKIPMANELKKGQSYTFSFTFPTSMTVIIKVDGKNTSVTSGQDIQITPSKTGQLAVYANNSGIFYYNVVDSPSYPYQNQIAQVNSQHTALSSTTKPSAAIFMALRADENKKKVAGLEYTNTGRVTYTAADGTEVTNQASGGKHKVLYFTSLSSNRYVDDLSNIIASWDELKNRNIDFYIIDVTRATKEKVTQVKNSLGASDEIKFIYSTQPSGNGLSVAATSLSEYQQKVVSNLGERYVDSYTLEFPTQIYIDSDNKLQMVELGVTPVADQVIQNIDDYLVDHIQRRNWNRSIRQDLRGSLKEKLKNRNLRAELITSRRDLQVVNTAATTATPAVTVTCDSATKVAVTNGAVSASVIFSVKGSLDVTAKNIALATNSCGAKILGVTKGATEKDGSVKYTLQVAVTKAGSFSYTVSDAKGKVLATSPVHTLTAAQVKVPAIKTLPNKTPAVKSNAKTKK